MIDFLNTLCVLLALCVVFRLQHRVTRMRRELTGLRGLARLERRHAASQRDLTIEALQGINARTDRIERCLRACGEDT